MSLPEQISASLGERHRLTLAETAVLSGLIAGCTPAELAVSRACSPATIRVHIRALHAKLNISRSMALLPLVMAELARLNIRAGRPSHTNGHGSDVGEDERDAG